MARAHAWSDRLARIYFSSPPFLAAVPSPPSGELAMYLPENFKFKLWGIFKVEYAKVDRSYESSGQERGIPYPQRGPVWLSRDRSAVVRPAVVALAKLSHRFLYDFSSHRAEHGENVSKHS